MKDRIPERKKVILSILTQLRTFYEGNIEPRLYHEHADPCAFCKHHKASGVDDQYREMLCVYCVTAFEDTASILALLEIIRDSPDSEFAFFARDTFNYSYLTKRTDPEMLAALVPLLENETDPNLLRVIYSALVTIQDTDASPDQLRKIMAAVTGPSRRGLQGGPPLESFLRPHAAKNPEVYNFLVGRVSSEHGLAAMAILMSLPVDKPVYDAIVPWMSRDDARECQNQSLWLFRHGNNHPDLSPRNPLAVDYAARLVDLFAATSRQEVRVQIMTSLVEFDLPQAAEAESRFLRDERLPDRERTQALLNLISRADHAKEPYTSSYEAWMKTLQSLGSDPAVASEVRVRSYTAWLAVVHAHGDPASGIYQECLRVIYDLQNDPNPEMRTAGKTLLDRARKYGIGP